MSPKTRAAGLLAAALLASLTAAGCRPSASEPGAAAGAAVAGERPAGSAVVAHRDEPEHEELPRQVRLRPEVIAAAGIKTVPVQRQVLRSTRLLPGEIALDPDRSARISSPSAGRLEEVRLREGTTVKKGDVVAVVRVPELGRVHGAQSAAASRARSARSNATRLEDLSRRQLASEQSWLDARAEAEASEAESRALAGQLTALGSGGGGAPFLLPLRAPVSGIVVAREAVVGQPVAADQVLATVSDLEEVWFLARVFEKDLDLIRVGAPVDVQLNAYAGQRFAGVVELVGQQIDPVARTVTARVRLANRDGRLRLGLFGAAQVAVASDTKEEARLTVPRDAVTELAGRPVVFVQHPDGDFEAHPVVLGRSAPGQVEVLAGLREGELVVSEGVFSLKSVVLRGTLAEED
ncbi:MAG: efflux RND transporter periplasmic adaptor subunit [Myxococcales bacterium]|nr:MAG: efflux RND transporter periplasmic adaptor subunit [Myxococcales bacterium]